MRRIYFLLGIIGVIALGGIAAYFLRSGGINFLTATPPPPPAGGTLPPVPPPADGNGPTNGSSATPPPPSNQSFGVVTKNHTVLDYFVDASNVVTFIQPDGKVYSLRDGNLATISNEEIPVLTAAWFSSDGQFILGAARPATETIFSVFSLTTKTWQPAPPATEAAAWAPATSSLALLIKRGGTQSLATYHLGSKAPIPQEVMQLHQQDLMLQWVAPSKVLLVEKGSLLFTSSLWSVDLQRKTLVPLITSERGLETLYYEKERIGAAFIANQGGRGGKFLVFSENPKPYLLSFLTIPSKCTFGEPQENLPAATSSPPLPPLTSYNALLFCGVPRDAAMFNLEELPDDYYTRALFTTDNIYRVDLRDGSTQLVFGDTNFNLDVQNVKLVQNKLFFVNRIDKKLYAVAVTP